MPRDFEVTDDQPEPLDALIARVQCPVLGVFGEAHFLTRSTMCAPSARRWSATARATT